MKSLYENKKTAEKIFKRNYFVACLLCKFKQQKSNLLKQVDQHEETFTVIFIVIKCCGLYCTFGTSVINPLCICYELASTFVLFYFSVDFLKFISPFVVISGVKDFLRSIFKIKSEAISIQGFH